MKYTEEELKNIKQDYLSGMKPFELSVKYGRSSGSIINKLKAINVYVDSRNNLTSKEKEALSALYRDGDWASINKQFPSLTKNNVYDLMSRLGIKGGNKNYWSDKDKEIIKKYYLLFSVEDIATMINYRHSIPSIQTLAFREYGYSKLSRWSETELNVLKENYSILPLDELSSLLPGRSENAISLKARQLKLKSYYSLNIAWNEEEKSFIQNNWENKTDEEMAQILGKPFWGVREQRQQMRLYRCDHQICPSYTDISHFFRGQIYEWKKDSMEKCRYCCVLTGSKDFKIHHIVSMATIIIDFFEKYPELLKQHYSEYTKDELSKLKDLFVKHHINYPLGVCVRSDLHDLFHKEFGRGNNTQEQWDLFCDNYRKGKYHLKEY